MQTNTIGFSNTANGYEALHSNTDGYSNTAIGESALTANTKGDYNTAVGFEAFNNGTAYSNSTAIGNSSAITASNQVRIGNNAVTSIGGFANWSNVSDRRFKKDIQENVAGLDFINSLRPVTYKLDMDAIANHLDHKERNIELEKEKAAEIQTGFIAQEVEAAAKESGYKFSGVDAPKNDNDHYGLRYAEFTVPLVKAVQELSAELEESRQQNQQLKADNEEMKTKLQELDQMRAELDKIKLLLNTKAT
ncbi:MAG: hypothetical protein GY810_15655 [Aureispira sp.]|nr:hypothetical protein [Aureispira sp.]